MDVFQSPNSRDVAARAASVSTCLLDTGDGEAAAVIDGLVFAMKTDSKPAGNPRWALWTYAGRGVSNRHAINHRL